MLIPLILIVLIKQWPLKWYLLLLFFYFCFKKFYTFEIILNLIEFFASQSERNLNDEFLKVFQFFDDDDTGKITFKNLKRVAKELGEDISDDHLREMIDEADLNGDGEVDENEFIYLLKRTNLYT